MLEPNGIANNAAGMVAVGGWAPKATLNTAATRGQFIKSHTVAGQATPHSSPQQEGDFAVSLEASSTPAVTMFGSPNAAVSGGAGTVTNTGTLTSGKAIIGNGTVDVTVSAASGVAHLASGTLTGSNVVLTSEVTGVLPAANGGTKLVQVVNTQIGTVATGTTVIPLDNTIPQNTEGDEYMTLAITPTSSSNKLRIDVVLFGTSNASNWVSAALFQDSTANSLAAMAGYQTIAGGGINLKFTHYMTAGTTSSTTFKVRAGRDASAGSTMTFNGASGTQIFGGVMASSLTISEIVP